MIFPGITGEASGSNEPPSPPIIGPPGPIGPIGPPVWNLFFPVF